MASILNATTTSGLVTSADNSGSLQLQTNNGTTAVTIDTSQRVGVGTASPTRLLSVGTLGTTSSPTINIGGSSTSTQTIEFGKGTSGADPFDGYIQYTQSNSTMAFGTNGATERMRITSGGQVLVNQTSSSGANEIFGVGRTDNGTVGCFRATNASQNSDVVLARASRNTTNGSFQAITYYNDGAGAYKFIVADSGNVTNTNGSYGTISDAKLKENIVDATSKLDKVNQLKVRNFNLIGDDLKQIGFVAQEFEQVFPSMVEESQDRTPDGEMLDTTTKTIKTTVLIPILVKAIQELKAELDATKAEVQALKGAK